MKKILLSVLVIFSCVTAHTQNGGLLDELDDMTAGEDSLKTEYTYATFKAERLINSHSIEIPARNELLVIIAHRFGSLENGIYDMFGMDVATMRWGFEYTLPTDFVCVGVGRSTYLKTYDGFVKVKLFRQSEGARKFPFSIAYVGDMAVRSQRLDFPERKNYFTSRLMYTNQLLIARKFSRSLSLQIMPTVVHKNLVARSDEQNTFFSLGVGGRMKLTNRVSLNMEYFGFIPGQKIPTVGGFPIRNTFAIGFDIETGGHVFQLQFTNARAMFDGGYLSETRTDFFAPQGRGIHFGFNLTRTFSFKKE